MKIWAPEQSRACGLTLVDQLAKCHSFKYGFNYGMILIWETTKWNMLVDEYSGTWACGLTLVDKNQVAKIFKDSIFFTCIALCHSWLASFSGVIVRLTTSPNKLCDNRNNLIQNGGKDWRLLYIAQNPASRNKSSLTEVFSFKPERPSKVSQCPNICSISIA